MERPAWAPQGIDISMPSVSRMYDFYLGGSHNFEVDREAARKAMEFMPGLPKIMQANRAFMRRAVRYALGEGITQFLDIGSGIPTFGNVHEVAQGIDPQARVAYVDHDPVAVAHSQAVLEGNSGAVIATADLRRPKEIRDNAEISELLDFDRPVALLLVAVLHFIEDSDDPQTAVAELRDLLAPGSLLVITHASYEGVPLTQEEAGGAVGVYKNIRNPLIMRSRDEVGRFFEGYEMIDPGLVPMPNWRPDTPAGQENEDPYAFSGFAGVGRKA
ncbi:SAM-dependent methyltransferase [Streptomyces brevispora]|uniref:SAM-dependent methyltransferase n=1 Tax=Streptomyces brevispora TaxID=887462 RepID=A0ABZ1FW92_9ACTN|nr:SAM-dependent methyltransferase [Streptomyces brevispora]WSC11858.1 SAM-dependent methyltransferase [Streptomyces brevispora]